MYYQRNHNHLILMLNSSYKMGSRNRVARAAALISALCIIESNAHEGKNHHTHQESIDIDHTRTADGGNRPLSQKG